MNGPLRARPLTAGAFAPFGRLAQFGPDRTGFVDALINRRPEARPHLDITLIGDQTLPLPTRVMERHRFSSQSFVPLDVSRYLLLVAPATEQQEPDLSRAIAFAARGDQAITYRPGTWHVPMAPIDRPGRFAVLTWRVGGAGDEEFVSLQTTLEIRLT